jgi:hypothetical protein
MIYMNLNKIEKWDDNMIIDFISDNTPANRKRRKPNPKEQGKQKQSWEQEWQPHTHSEVFISNMYGGDQLP